MAKGTVKFWGGPLDGFTILSVKESTLSEIIFFAGKTKEWETESYVDTGAVNCLSYQRRPEDHLTFYRRIARFAYEWEVPLVGIAPTSPG